jgi:hypothetical protein
VSSIVHSESKPVKLATHILLACLITIALVVLALIFDATQRSSATGMAYTPLSADSVNETMRRGSSIFMALNNYRDNHVVYPRSLDTLVSEGWISEIEPPTAGLPRWYYSTSDDATWCQLKFGPGLLGSETDPWPSYFLSSNSDIWYSDF